MGQGVFYFLAVDHIRRHLGGGDIDDAYIEDASTFIADSMTTTLAHVASR